MFTCLNGLQNKHMQLFLINILPSLCMFLEVAANPGMGGPLFHNCLWALLWMGINYRSQDFSHCGKDYRDFCPLLTTGPPLGLWMGLKVPNRKENVVNALKSTLRTFFHGSGGQAGREGEGRRRNRNSACLPRAGSGHPPVMAHRSALSALSK